jgi:hypothetical protein
MARKINATCDASPRGKASLDPDNLIVAMERYRRREQQDSVRASSPGIPRVHRIRLLAVLPLSHTLGTSTAIPANATIAALSTAVLEAAALPENPTTQHESRAHRANITCPVSCPRTAEHLLARSPIQTLRGDRGSERKIQASGRAKWAPIPRDPSSMRMPLKSRRASPAFRAPY